jgi:hypothetical protein
MGPIVEALGGWFMIIVAGAEESACMRLPAFRELEKCVYNLVTLRNGDSASSVFRHGQQRNKVHRHSFVNNFTTPEKDTNA